VIFYQLPGLALGAGETMKRREFIALLGSAIVAMPRTARAQQTRKIPKIGVLWHAGSAEEERIPLGALVQGFKDIGYVEGQNIIFEHRFPNEQPERFDVLATELVQIKVDVFIAVTRQGALAAQKATKTIPIVFVVVPDPVGSKLVDSLNKPGGNITGITNMAFDLVPKRVELLKEAIPSVSRMALVINGSYQEAAHRYVEMGQSAATGLGIVLEPIDMRSVGDFATAFSAMKDRQLQAASLTVDGLFYANQARLAALAREQTLPLMGYTREMAEQAGFFLAYGPSNVAIFNRVSYFVDRILKGEKPTDLPVEQPTKFKLVVNQKVAKALGIDVPTSILLRANELID
jgi:putative ABC transport system substrate-binding protein